MSWTVGIKPAGRELIMDIGASNNAATDALVTDLPTSYQSGANMPTVNLQTALAAATCPFACYKDVNSLTDFPVQQAWGDTQAVGLQTGTAVHGTEITLARYLVDRGRAPAILTHAVSSAGAKSYANAGATRTALHSHINTRLADIGEAFVLRAILVRVFTGDTGSEADAQAIGTKLATIFSEVCALCEAVSPGSADSTAFLIGEVHQWFIDNAGEWGPTAKDALDTWLATPVAGHAKYSVPVNEYAAGANDTGEAVTDLNPTELHPGSAYIQAIGERFGKVLMHRQVLPVYRT